MTAVTLANLATLRQDLADLIDVDTVDAAYPVEQSKETTGPVWVTVMFGGANADYLILVIRLYSAAGDDTTEATDRLEAAMADIDAALLTDSIYPKPTWSDLTYTEATPPPNQRPPMLLVSASVALGREDP